MRRIIGIALVFLIAVLRGAGTGTPTRATGQVSTTSAAQSQASLTPIQELGKKLFFDARLSTPEGQACAACHASPVGWTGPDPYVNKNGGVYEGAVKGRHGNRRPPTAAYAGSSPVLNRNAKGDFVGGMFWDGRATGETLGDPLAEQAMVPFLNQLEQNNFDAGSVVAKVRNSDYAALFEQVWGAGSLDPQHAQAAYEKIGRSIAAFERSAEVNPFSSKFDDFWRAARAQGLDPAGLNEANAARYANLGLDDKELDGLRLFATKGLCSGCHVLTSTNGQPPVFTDFTYDNIGVPKNPQNPYYAMPAPYNPDGKGWLDRGLGGVLQASHELSKHAGDNMGKFKVPTLRNADRRPFPGFVKAYMHNGFFKSLEDVVHFYNTRDVAGAGWPPPETARNVNTSEMGRLGLTPVEESLIVVFLKTLSDR